MTATDIWRALTLRQPWADLGMAGVKDVENRTWPVPSTLPQWLRCTHSECGHRQDPECALDWCDNDHHGEPDGPFPFRLWVHAGQEWDMLPVDHPAINAYLSLPTPLTCIACGWSGRIGSGEPPPPGCPDVDRDGIHDFVEPRNRLGRTGVLLGEVTVTGCHWANWNDDPCIICSSLWAQPGTWHWTLTDPVPLPEPIPMRGRQGLWHLPADLEVPA